MRLFIDDTCGFGVLGATGRGILEHTGVPIEDIDLLAASLEYSVAAYGGFCAGTHFIIDHQRLSGLGYCFSASLPPLQAAVGLEAIKLIDQDPKMVHDLRKNCELFHEILVQSRVLHVDGISFSPVKHLRRKANSSETRKFLVQSLEDIVDRAREQGLALTVARYVDHIEHKLPEPSIRLTVSNLLTEEDIRDATAKIIKLFEES